jgi:lipoprotein Spr
MRQLTICLLFLILGAKTQAQQGIDSLLTGETTTYDSLCNDSLLQYWTEKYALLPGMLNQPLLLALFEDWKGTPYRYGGNSRKGIDCSGFVSLLYDSVYRIRLEGGSADIYRKMVPIDKAALSEGDLVFFKIHKRRISHVGLYLSNDKFIHATTRGGVMINDLKEPYYRRYFYSAARIGN